MVIDQSIAQPSSVKVLAVDGNLYRKPQLINIQRIRVFGMLTMKCHGCLYHTQPVKTRQSIQKR